MKKVWKSGFWETNDRKHLPFTLMRLEVEKARRNVTPIEKSRFYVGSFLYHTLEYPITEDERVHNIHRGR